MKPSKTRVCTETALALVAGLLAVAVAAGAVARRHWRMRLAG
jgi:hypothetical protein